jgi:hypothetical protein
VLRFRRLTQGFQVALLAALFSLDPAHAAEVAVFDNASFVDTTSRKDSAESDNVQTTLELLGHSVTPFTEIDAIGLRSAIVGKRAVVIPELERGDLGAALSEQSRTEFAGYVADGGILIVHGTSDRRATNFLNLTFGWSLSAGVVGPSQRGEDATGSPYESAPTTLEANARTRGLYRLTLPPRALAMYVNRSRAPVVELPFGGGRVIYLGWDWYAAVPRGDQDGGWISVLAAATNAPGGCAGGNTGDIDGDGIPDACDPDDGCEDIDGRRRISNGSWVTLRDHAGGSYHELEFSGTFLLPIGTTYASLDPHNLPFAFVMVGINGNFRVAHVFDQSRYEGAGSAGWRLGGRGQRWIFADTTGHARDGFISAVVRDLSHVEPGRVRLRVLARGGDYPVSRSGEALKVLLVVGNSSIGECAEGRYARDDCVLMQGQSQLMCRL